MRSLVRGGIKDTHIFRRHACPTSIRFPVTRGIFGYAELPFPKEFHSMTRARCELISLSDTPYYHCIARWVRWAFLCGIDRHSGTDFSHRRSWLVERLGMLSTLFAIDVCAYAVMSNHYHLVLKVDAARAQSWSVDDVIVRWSWLFVAPALVQRYRDGACLDDAERDRALGIVEL